MSNTPRPRVSNTARPGLSNGANPGTGNAASPGRSSTAGPGNRNTVGTGRSDPASPGMRVATGLGMHTAADARMCSAALPGRSDTAAGRGGAGGAYQVEAADPPAGKTPVVTPAGRQPRRGAGIAGWRYLRRDRHGGLLTGEAVEFAGQPLAEQPTVRGAKHQTPQCPAPPEETSLYEGEAAATRDRGECDDDPYLKVLALPTHHQCGRCRGVDDVDVDRAVKSVEPVRVQAQPRTVGRVPFGRQEPSVELPGIGQCQPYPLTRVVEVDIKPYLRHRIDYMAIPG
ncbi:MAG: hypothetical protein QOI74_2114 [Micromonosporaceae bacterium]|nr:hypothetical protein [Micromonosporaceae bacterium]